MICPHPFFLLPPPILSCLLGSDTDPTVKSGWLYQWSALLRSRGTDADALGTEAMHTLSHTALEC